MRLILPLLAILGAGCESILGIKDTYVVDPAGSAADAAAAPIDAVEAASDTAGPSGPPSELVSVSLINAATEEPFHSPVHVTIRGTGRSVVVDEQGALRTEYPDIYEMLRFGFSASATFPVSLVIEASGPGFLPTSYPLVMYERADVTAELRLVSVENLPAGIYVAQNTSGVLDDSGRLASPVTIETRNPARTGATATVTAPAGIVMRDKDGVPLSGSITLQMAHFESGNQETLAAFPGGMDVTTNEGDGLFSTAGLLSMEIRDASGRHAATFESGSLTAVVTIPTGTMNPDENREIQPGDTIGVWSQNAETGVWTREGNVTVSSVNGSLQAEFSMPHLSLWNLDFKFNKCDISREIELYNGSGFNLVAPEIAQHFVYSIEYKNPSGVVSYVKNFRAGDLRDADRGGPLNVLQFRNAPDEDSGTTVLRVYWEHQADEHCLLSSKVFTRRCRDGVCIGTPLCADFPEAIDVTAERRPEGCGEL